MIRQAAGSTASGSADLLPPGWWLPAIACGEADDPLPTWVDAIEHAVRGDAGDEPVPADWKAAFALPFRPLVAAARDQVTTLARPLVTDQVADLDAVGHAVARWLDGHLVTRASRALVATLSDHAERGLLAGTDSRQRFADFVRRVATPAGRAALFTEYPVLARGLAQTCAAAATAAGELLGH